MQQMKLIASVLAFTSLSVLSTSSANASAEFTVQTGSQPGFTDGQKNYTLGMSAADFKGQFGVPDKETETDLCYFSDGLIVHVADGRVESFDFCVTRQDFSSLGLGKFKAARVTTDQQVKAGSSVREAIKAHGEPIQKFDAVGTSLKYARGWIKFDENGVLNSFYVKKA